MPDPNLADWLGVEIYNQEAREPGLSFGDVLTAVVDRLLALPIEERAAFVQLRPSHPIPATRERLRAEAAEARALEAEDQNRDRIVLLTVARHQLRAVELERDEAQAKLDSLLATRAEEIATRLERSETVGERLDVSKADRRTAWGTVIAVADELERWNHPQSALIESCIYNLRKAAISGEGES